MFELDRIPPAVLNALAEKGIPPEQVLLGARCDRSLELNGAEVYLFATAESLLVLTGVTTL